VFNVKSLALFLVLAAAPSLAAQDKDKVCNDLQQKPMRVGQWASYRWTGGRTDGATMHMAVVGSEAVGGAPYYWLEVVFDDAKGNTGKTVLQMLVPGLGNLAADVRGMILKTGAEPAMRMPEEMVRRVVRWTRISRPSLDASAWKWMSWGGNRPRWRVGRFARCT